MITIGLTDTELMEAFESATLPSDQFHHAEHVRIAWLFVRRDGMPGALSSFAGALQRFAIAKGAPHLYHATITWAYLLIIHAREQASRATDWATFARAHPDLLTWRPSILDAYYTPETLWSDQARRIFLMPDRLGSRGHTGDAADKTQQQVNSHGVVPALRQD